MDRVALEMIILFQEASIPFLKPLGHHEGEVSLQASH